MTNYNEQPELSIVVPVYNVADYLEECVESIINQSYSNWELILVDDGSKDRSGEICDIYSNRDDRVKVIHKDNGGLSSARNAGLDAVRGIYVTFVDSDDVILGNDTFAKLMEILAEDKYLDAVQYDVIYKYLSDDQHKRSYPFKIYCNTESIMKGYLDQDIHVSCCDKIFKAHVFKDIRFPLHQISEDIAVIPQIVKRLNRLRTTNIGYYGYRYREGSISSSTLPYWKICSILGSYYKYLSYAMEYNALIPKAMEMYTQTFWQYLSIVRTRFPDKLKDFSNQTFFIRFGIKKWIKYGRFITLKKDLVRSFFLIVCGIIPTIIVQKLITRK